MPGGLGLATFNDADIGPGAPCAVAQGIRSVYVRPGQAKPALGDWAVSLNLREKPLKPVRQ